MNNVNLNPNLVKSLIVLALVDVKKDIKDKQSDQATLYKLGTAVMNIDRVLNNVLKLSPPSLIGDLGTFVPYVDTNNPSDVTGALNTTCYLSCELKKKIESVTQYHYLLSEGSSKTSDILTEVDNVLKVYSVPVKSYQLDMYINIIINLLLLTSDTVDICFQKGDFVLSIQLYKDRPNLNRITVRYINPLFESNIFQITRGLDNYSIMYTYLHTVYTNSYYAKASVDITIPYGIVEFLREYVFELYNEKIEATIPEYLTQSVATLDNTFKTIVNQYVSLIDPTDYPEGLDKPDLSKIEYRLKTHLEYTKPIKTLNNTEAELSRCNISTHGDNLENIQLGMILNQIAFINDEYVKINPSITIHYPSRLNKFEQTEVTDELTLLYTALIFNKVNQTLLYLVESQ